MSSELSIGELTALFCVIALALIPLSIWAFHYLETRVSDRSIDRDRRPIVTKFE